MNSGDAGTSDNMTAWSSKMSWNPVNNTLYCLGGAHCGSGEDCPAAMVMLRYSDAANAWMQQLFTGVHTYESTTINTTSGTANKFYHVVYSVPRENFDHAFLLAIRRRAGSVYITDRSGANPYDCLPAGGLQPESPWLRLVTASRGLYKDAGDRKTAR